MDPTDRPTSVVQNVLPVKTTLRMFSAAGRMAGRVQAGALCTCLWFRSRREVSGPGAWLAVEHGERNTIDRKQEDSLGGGNRHLRAEDSQGRILSISEQQKVEDRETQ